MMWDIPVRVPYLTRYLLYLQMKFHDVGYFKTS